MAIAVDCPSCQFSFRVADRQAGRRGRCPRCKAEIVAPAPLEATGIQANEAFEAFFLDSLSLLQPIRMPPHFPGASKNLRASKQALVDARRDMQLAQKDNLHCLMRWNILQPRLVKAEAAVAMIRAGCKIQPEQFELRSASLEEAQSACSAAQDGLRAMHQAMEPFLSAASDRLTHALAFLWDDSIKERLAGGAIRFEQSTRIYPTAAFLANRVIPELPSVHHAMQVSSRLLLAVSEGKNGKNDRFLGRCLESSGLLAQRNTSLRTTLLGGPKDVLINESGDVSLAQYAFPAGPSSSDPIALVHAAGNAVDELTTLYRHVTGRLAVVVEEVEKVLGLGPLVPLEDS